MNVPVTPGYERSSSACHATAYGTSTSVAPSARMRSSFAAGGGSVRSGEGRGGEEGGYWWGPDTLKKKKKEETAMTKLSNLINNNQYLKPLLGQLPQQR